MKAKVLPNGSSVDRNEFPAHTPAITQTDGYTRLIFYDVKTRDINRKRIMETTDLDFLME